MHTDTPLHPRHLHPHRLHLPRHRQPQGLVRVDGRSLVVPDDGRRWHGRRRREEEVPAGRQRGGEFERGRMHDVM